MTDPAVPAPTTTKSYEFEGVVMEFPLRSLLLTMIR
jgi:hypothetical protein